MNGLPFVADSFKPVTMSTIASIVDHSNLANQVSSGICKLYSLFFCHCMNVLANCKAMLV